MYNTRELRDAYRNRRETLVEEAAEAGVPFSAYLDTEYDPEKDGELGADDERLSAMEVVLDDLDMTTECNPAAGMWPTRCEDVIDDPAKMFALKELSLNAYRSVSYTPQIQAAARAAERRERWERAGTFQSTHDTAPGTTLTPYFDGSVHWDQDVEVDIALEELTTRFAETNKEDYRTTVMHYDEDAFREERRSAAADPPMARFETSERPIQPKKRMLALPFTYEHLRMTETIDKALEHVEEIAVGRIMAKVDEGLETMLLGAGGDNLGGTLLRLQALDPDATDAFTPRAWLALQKKFKRTYMLTSCIAPDENITDLQLAKVGDTNVMLTSLVERQNAVMSGFGGQYAVMNQLSQGVRVGWHDYLIDRIIEKRQGESDQKHNAFIAYDKRKAVEFVSQMNSDIKETTRDMLKQVEYIVCSETWGWISYQPKKAIYVIVMGNPHADATFEIAA